MKLRTAVLSLHWLLVPIGMPAQEVAAPKVPLEHFFRDPDLGKMELSPDGQYLAVIASEQDKTYLVAVDLQSGKRKALIEGDIYEFQWLSNQRLLYRAGGIGLGGLFAVNRDGTRHQVLLPPLLHQIHGPNFRLRYASFLSLIAGDADSLLIEIAEFNPYVRPRLPRPEVRRLNYFTGKSQVEEKNPGNVVEWLTDLNGSVRAAVALDEDKYRLLYRTRKGDPWRIIHESDLNDPAVVPLHFQARSNQLLVAAYNGKNTRGLYGYDPETRRLGSQIWHHDEYDLTGIWGDDTTDALLGVVFQAERLRFHWIDPELKSLQGKVDEALPETVNQLVDGEEDSARYLFLAQSDRNPGIYYLINNARQEFGPFGKLTHLIKPEQMSPTKPIAYVARDGLKIHGYLTLPLGPKRTNLAMVVMPHGGPAGRDSWGFDPEVQFLANRGYAVLQLNFRGSTGYGKDFERAGYRQWGGKMEDDITDGVRWAIQEGVADPKRIAIFGSSYGGYAALMGLILTPELYRCGISYAGVTDIAATLRQRAVALPKAYRFQLREQVGDYREEREDLKAASPLEHVEKIRAPVFLAYGGRDPLVDVEQGKKLAKELKKLRKPYEFMLEEQEGHGFQQATNRIKLFRRLEAFLESHLR